MELSLPMHAVWCWVNPEGHLQVKPPIVFTQRNWQLCCLVEHSSKSGRQNVIIIYKPLLVLMNFTCYITNLFVQWGDAEGEPTFTSLSIWLQDVPSGARAQVTALCVLTQEVARLGGLRTLIQIWNTEETVSEDHSSQLADIPWIVGILGLNCGDISRKW